MLIYNAIVALFCVAGVALGAAAAPCTENYAACKADCEAVNGVLANYNGIDVCACKEGFTPSDTREICVDRDECTSGDAACPKGAYCVNTIGSYECLCNDGFAFDPLLRECRVPNLCDRALNLCPRGKCCGLDSEAPGGIRCVDPDYDLSSRETSCPVKFQLQRQLTNPGDLNEFSQLFGRKQPIVEVEPLISSVVSLFQLISQKNQKSGNAPRRASHRNAGFGK